MLRRMMCLAIRSFRLLLCCWALAACAHASAPAAPSAAASSAAKAPQRAAAVPANAPELLEVRVLTVAYKQTQSVSERTREQAEQRARMLSSMAREGEKLS